jgi:nucleoside-diphosphate-sugar epimerase
LAAERLLQGSTWGDRTIVLRLAGIYGPGRIPRRRELQAGRPLDAPAEGLVNLIHVEDAVAAVLAVEQRGRAPALYCLSDGQPVERRAYYGELARLLDAPNPRFVPPPPESAAAERAAASKRIRPDRFLADLRFEFTYPSYREGLAAILREERSGEYS